MATAGLVALTDASGNKNLVRSISEPVIMSPRGAGRLPTDLIVDEQPPPAETAVSSIAALRRRLLAWRCCDCTR
jgi:hypothetical protein